MTANEVIEIVIRDLENVCIPMAFMNPVGIPIARSIENLKVLLEAIKSQDKQNQKEDKEAQTNEIA